MPAKFFRDASEKFTDAMGAAERFSIGVNERAKRLKQAMFPDEIKPGESAAGTAQQGMNEAGQEMMQDQLERVNMRREKMKRR